MIELRSKLLEADWKALVIIQPLLPLVHYYNVVNALTQVDKRGKLV